MELAIVGLRAAGKTTLFQALAGGPVAGAVATVPVPDHRLEQLAAHFRPRKVTPPEALLHDLPPWPDHGQRLPQEAATALARADALILVVRAFHRPDVPHPQGHVDPQRDYLNLELELLYHDLDIVTRRLEKVAKVATSAPPGEREAAQRERRTLERVKACLESERPLREEELSPEERKLLSPFGLLSLRPLLVVVNSDDPAQGREMVQALESRHGRARTAFASLCAQLELELAQMEKEEAVAFRQELGLPPEGPRALLRQVMDLLELVTFYTVVGEECRAWLVAKGTTALEAAGKIHSDMARGFVRAEVIAWDRLLAAGTLHEARARGMVRAEGKSYLVQDGDVLHILFH